MFSKYGCGNQHHQPGDTDFCSCFQDGYENGREKGYMELANWEPGDHHQDCGCRPCSIARTIIRKYGAYRALAG